MKKYPIHRASGMLIFFTLFCGLFQTVHAYEERMQFHSLFPKNNLTKATELCKHVWGMFDTIIKNNNGSDRSKKKFERAIGQLVLAQHFLTKVAKQKEKPQSDQLHYASRVIGTVEDRFGKVPRIDSDLKSVLKKQIIHVKKLLEKQLR